jgi:hypothetical protein
MESRFVLKNALESFKKDTFYRLDFVRGVALTNSYQSGARFRTLWVNFSEFLPEYQSLDAIRTLRTKDRFKDKIQSKPNTLDFKPITVEKNFS